MKIIKVKRLRYDNLRTHEICYGGVEYDGHLTDDNILGGIHEIGKTEIGIKGYNLYQKNQNGEYIYCITVETFYQYQKTWFDNLMDGIKRILGL